MQAKGKGGSTRGGGIGRATHPADKTLLDVIRAQRKIYATAETRTEETLWQYFLTYGFTRRKPGGGGTTRGGGTGRLRVGYHTRKSDMLAKLFKGLRWLAVRESVSFIMYLANQAALNIANDNANEVYADGATRTAYDFRDDYYALPYTEKVVEALARDHLLNVPARTVAKDKDTEWTRRMLQSIVSRFDLEQEDLDALPGRIARELTRRCQRAMDATTQALIYGVFDYGMYQAGLDAQDAGVDAEKTWLSIMDNRVRDSHAHLHKTTLPVDGIFHGYYGDLRFPHDPSAPPAEIMHCRCRLAIHAKGKAPNAPDRLTSAQVAAYRRWRDKVIDDLGGELALAAEHRRRLRADH